MRLVLLSLFASGALAWSPASFLALPLKSTGSARMASLPRTRPSQSLALDMKVAVFGASGLTGKEVVFQALKRGEGVVALARTPSKVTKPQGSCGADAVAEAIADANLQIIGGDVTKQADVDKVFAAGDITSVVVALGGKTADVGETMLTDGTANIIRAMQAKGVKRISVVTSIGAGDSEKQAPFFFKMLMFTVMKKIFTDKNNQEALFFNGIGKSLEYCIVRPGGLTVEPPTGIINVIEGQAGSIPRADVADFCLGACLEPAFPYIGKAACISSVGGTAWSKDRSAAARGQMQ
jgi:putative NADH-flavin reductase